MHIVAHRGLHARAPENSLAAVRAALDAGVEYIEVDVRLTRDGIPVLMHDAFLARTTSSDRHVIELTASTLATVRLADGSPLPRFIEATELCRGRATLCADIKDPAAAPPVIAVANDMGCDLELWSSSREVVAYAADHEVYPAWISHGLMPPAGVESLADEGAQLGARAISFFPADLLPSVAAACHRFGLDVMSGTPNDRATWEQLLALEARAIITDRPIEAGDWLARVALRTNAPPDRFDAVRCMHPHRQGCCSRAASAALVVSGCGALTDDSRE